MKDLSLFSGIGAFEKACDNLGISTELVAFCEIDEHAAKSYAAIHGVPESMNLGDITKVDEKKLPKDIDLITYGFPCQDISLCGKQKGLFNEDGTQTRSGLFFEALRIIEETQPKVAIAENVKNLTSKKFALQFKIVLDSLEKAGYTNYFKVLNAKDYGIPQDRERVFIVSIRNDLCVNYDFPVPVKLTKTMGDFTEEKVSENYFLTSTQVTNIQNWKAQQRPFKRILGRNSICPTLTARGAGEYHSGMILYSPDLDETCNCDRENLKKDIRYRVITEKESFRLMGFDDSDFEKAKTVCKKAQLYKQAGNSIVVPVVQSIIQGLIDCGVLEGV